MKIAQPTTPLSAASRLQRARKRHHLTSLAAGSSCAATDGLASRLRGTLSSTVLMGTSPSGEMDASLSLGTWGAHLTSLRSGVWPVGAGRCGQPHPGTEADPLDR